MALPTLKIPDNPYKLSTTADPLGINGANIPGVGSGAINLGPSPYAPPDAPTIMSAFIQSLEPTRQAGYENIKNLAEQRGSVGSGAEYKAYGKYDAQLGQDVLNKYGEVYGQGQTYNQNQYNWETSKLESMYNTIYKAKELDPMATTADKNIALWLKSKLTGAPYTPIDAATGKPSATPYNATTMEPIAPTAPSAPGAPVTSPATPTAAPVTTAPDGSALPAGWSSPDNGQGQPGPAQFTGYTNPADTPIGGMISYNGQYLQKVAASGPDAFKVVTPEQYNSWKSNQNILGPQGIGSYSNGDVINKDGKNYQVTKDTTGNWQLNEISSPEQAQLLNAEKVAGKMPAGEKAFTIPKQGSSGVDYFLKDAAGNVTAMSESDYKLKDKPAGTIITTDDGQKYLKTRDGNPVKYDSPEGVSERASVAIDTINQTISSGMAPGKLEALEGVYRANHGIILFGGGYYTKGADGRYTPVDGTKTNYNKVVNRVKLAAVKGSPPTPEDLALLEYYSSGMEGA